MTNTSQQMRHLLTLLESSLITSTCDWDPASQTLLFTQQDMDLFVKNWQLETKPHDSHDQLAVVWDKIKQLLASEGITDVKARTRFPNPKYQFGLLLKNPQDKDRVIDTLKLSCFTTREPALEIAPTQCQWDQQSQMIVFSPSDLESFANSWKLHSKPGDTLGLVAQAVRLINDVIQGKGMSKNDYVLRTRITGHPQAVLGIRVNNPQHKDQVLAALRLKC